RTVRGRGDEDDEHPARRTRRQGGEDPRQIRRQPLRRPGDRGARLMGDIAKRCVISGKVQNVWYRAWTVQEAEKLGLNGWVRNRADGSVEALFAGPAEKIDTMIDLCHTGPRAARVTDVTAEDFKGEIPQGF